MRKWFYKLTALCIGVLVPLAAYAQYYEASGVPAARSLLNSADMRAEFLAIETGISDKLPALAGNGGALIAVNSGGTALEALSSGINIAQGGTGATTAAGARTALGLAIGTNVQAWDDDLDDFAALTPSNDYFLVGNGTDWTVESNTTARTTLGVGTGDSPQFTALNIGAATDTTLARSGAGELTVEGDAIWNAGNDGAGSGLDADLLDGSSSAAFLQAANNLSDLAAASTARTNLGLAIGTDVQAYDADLTTIGGLAKTDSNFIVGNGSAWVAESGATARTSLGLGSLATASTINNGNWSGTDLAVANGGTGASDADTARSNLDAADLEITQNIQNGNYTLVASDSGKHIYKSSGGAGETITIPANASVAYDVGTVITIINNGGGTLSIAITTDTLILANDGSTGTRTLADHGLATIIKVASTTWFISGAGVT